MYLEERPFLFALSTFYCEQGEVGGLCLRQSRTVARETVSEDTLIFCFSFFIVIIMCVCVHVGVGVCVSVFFCGPLRYFARRFSHTCSFEFVFVMVAGLLLDRIKSISNKDPFHSLCQLFYSGKGGI